MNEYEAARAARIAANRQKMEDLGVLDAVQQLQSKPARPRQPRSSKPRPAAEPLVVTRASKRIKGEAAEGAAQQVVDIDQLDQGSTDNRRKKKAVRDPNEPRFELTSTQYAAPFSLTSIGVTVHALGEVYRGPFSSNFWSSRGCLYQHAYPLGYHASKEAFGHVWDMRISAGEGVPIFTVSQRGGRRSFCGPTPTRPWTDVCLAFKTGQRISGPLYFGFSDVHMQRALAAMYTPEELAHALHDTPLTAASASVGAQMPCAQRALQLGTAAAAVAEGSLQRHADSGSSDSCDSTQQLQADRQQEQALCVAEAYAAELQAIQGIGAATAKVLALTTALGGARHDSLQALCSWLASDAAHPEQLQHYLLHSEEVPRCSRQLPSWREKWVPMIMQQLLAQL